MRRTLVLCLSFAVGAVLGGAVRADSLCIDDGFAKPGRDATVAVRLDATQSVAGIQARILFDHALLEPFGARKGALASPDMFLDASSSEPGVLNVVLCTGGGQQTLTSPSGVVFYLTFRVRSDATRGAFTPIRFDESLPHPFAVCGTSLSTPSGAEIEHTRRNGSFYIGEPTSAWNWTLYE